jgi:hypothetical protein
MSARSQAEVVVEHETKYYILVNLSTTTHMVSCLSDHGSPLLKSIQILVHSFDGMESNLRIPTERCCEVHLH